MLLIGSRSLYHQIVPPREIFDWDILINPLDFMELVNKSKILNTNIQEINQQLVEFKLAQGKFDLNILELSKTFEDIETPIGLVKNSPLWLNKILKMNHLKGNLRPKDLIDQYYLKDVQIPKEFEYLIELKQHQNSENNKKSFFNDNVPRLIDHDQLHIYIAKALNNPEPTYLKVVENGVEISQEKFNHLSYQQQLAVILEETLVLSLERWFLLKIHNNKTWTLWEHITGNRSVAYKILEKLCTPGQINKHPTWLSLKGRELYLDLYKSLGDYLQIIKYSMPKSFWDEVYTKVKNEKKS